MCMKSKSSYMKHKEVQVTHTRRRPNLMKTTLPAEGDDRWFPFSTEDSEGICFHHVSQAH